MKLLYFWATWCVVCKPGLQHKLPDLQKKYPDLSVIAVNIEEDTRRAKHYVKKWKIKVPISYSLNLEYKKSSAPYWKLYKKDKLLGEDKGFVVSDVEKFLR